jgi:hypothetical protein
MIDPPLAAFLQEGLGIHVGTRDARLQPAGARAIAVRPEPDGLHLLVYVSEVAAARLLDNLRDNLQAAVTFVRPVDDRACQVKGLFHDVRPASEAERGFVAAQWDLFLQQLEHIGIPRTGSASWVTWPAVVLRIRVNAVFDQTPGPHAGSPIQ